MDWNHSAISLIKKTGFLLAFAGSLTAGQPALAGYAVQELRAVETDQERQVRELREQEITQLRIALGRRLPQNRKADLYFRLAEIYLEAYRTSFLQEGRVHERRVSQKKSDRVIDRGYSKPFLKKGIQASQEILKLKIPYGRMDQVIYFLAYNFGELGDSAKSVQYYRQLATRFSSSSFAIEAYRELGTRAFQDNRFAEAEKYLLLASKNPRSEVARAEILHKLSWTYYRTKRFAQAIATLKQAIAGTDSSDEKFQSIREDALRDMALFMTERGQVDEAIAYFENTAGDRGYLPAVLEKLGREYERKVQPEKATRVYEALLKMNPAGEASLRVLAKLVDLDLRRSKWEQALRRLNAAQVTRPSEPESEVAYRNLRAMVRRTATEHHDRYRKKKKTDALPIAEAYYVYYLKNILSQDDSRNEKSEISMYLAEVKRALGKRSEASALYRDVIGYQDARYSKEAGALWAASLSDQIRASGKKSKLSQDAPSRVEREFIDAADQLEEKLPGTLEAREAALRAAQVLAGYEESRSEAVKRVEKIVERYPDSKQAVVAMELRVQMAMDRLPDPKKAQASDYRKGAEEVRDAIEWVESKKSNDAKLVARVRSLRSGIEVGEIAALEREGDLKEAANAYVQFARKSRSPERAQQAYENAVSARIKSDDGDAALEILAEWVKKFPKNSKAIESMRSLATALLIQGQYSKSADIFVSLAEQAMDAQALDTATRILEGTGEESKASSLRERYLKEFVRTAQGNAGQWEVALQLARSYDRAGKTDEAVRAYQYCSHGPVNYQAQCLAALADLLDHKGQSARAQGFYEKVAQQKSSKSEPASPFVGYARYQLARKLESSRKFQELRVPEKILQKGLEERLKFFESLTRAYLSVVDAGGPWAVAALERLALWAFQFADDIDAIDPPVGLTEQGLRQFRGSLGAVSTPLRTKATETLLNAMTSLEKAESYSPSARSISDRLADLRVAGVHRAQGYRGHLRITGMAADGGSQGRAQALVNVRKGLIRDLRNAAAWLDYGNLLWGEGNPGLAKIAYDRALQLDPKNADALNSRAVVVLSSQGMEDWYTALVASEGWKRALALRPDFQVAQLNRAILLNYYRLFKIGLPLWQSLRAKSESVDIYDGEAIALAGTGRGSVSHFKRAEELGAPKKRFEALYHSAASRYASGKSEKDADRCESEAEDIDGDELKGFDRDAVKHLIQVCGKWKKKF